MSAHISDYRIRFAVDVIDGRLGASSDEFSREVDAIVSSVNALGAVSHCEIGDQDGLIAQLLVYVDGEQEGGVALRAILQIRQFIEQLKANPGREWIQ